MKIVLLEGSPNPNGSTHLLAESFANGARETGHTVTVVDAAHAAIHPCTGYIRCGYEGPCAQKDEMETIRPMILQADMLVFATPVAVNSYTMALQMDADADLAGGIVLLTTSLSCLTLFLWILALKTLGLF